MEKSTISDDQQALHMEERAIANIYRARKERQLYSREAVLSV